MKDEKKKEDLKTGKRLKEWGTRLETEPKTQVVIKEIKKKLGFTSKEDEGRIQEEIQKKEKFGSLLAKFQGASNKERKTKFK